MSPYYSSPFQQVTARNAYIHRPILVLHTNMRSSCVFESTLACPSARHTFEEGDGYKASFSEPFAQHLLSRCCGYVLDQVRTLKIMSSRLKVVCWNVQGLKPWKVNDNDFLYRLN